MGSSGGDETDGDLIRDGEKRGGTRGECGIISLQPEAMRHDDAFLYIGFAGRQRMDGWKSRKCSHTL